MLKFHERYGDDFLIVSFNNNKDENDLLEEYCIENKINIFTSESVLRPDNRIKGRGHLNVNGNKELGELLYEAYTRTYKE